jgi:hypothetical protein
MKSCTNLADKKLSELIISIQSFGWENQVADLFLANEESYRLQPQHFRGLQNS